MGRFEIEQKYRIKNPAAARKLLKKFKAIKKGSGLEINHLYDSGRQLSMQGCVLRLRLHGKEGKLTYKGPRLKGPFKKRVETETSVDYRNTKKILEHLGYEPIVEYRKKREEFIVGKVHVTIDWVEKHGWFIEIEGPAKAIREWEKKLGLRPSQREERSYLEILYGKREFR